MSFKTEFNTELYERMIVDLQKSLGGADLKEIVDEEFKAVIRRSAEKTGQAKVKKINEELRKLKELTPRGGKVTPQWKRWLDKKKRVVAEKKRRVGLARQAWLQIADEAGLPVTGGRGLVKARKATVNNARKNHMVSARKTTKGKSQYSIRIRYAYPAGGVRAVRADSALRGALNAREKFYEVNLALGVFDTARDIAKRYPNIKVNRR